MLRFRCRRISYPLRNQRTHLSSSMKIPSSIAYYHVRRYNSQISEALNGQVSVTIDGDNKHNSSSVTIHPWVFNLVAVLTPPYILQTDPPDLVPVPLPPLAPPWLQDHEVLTGSSSQFDCPIAQFANFGTRVSEYNTSSPHTCHLFVEMPQQTTLVCNVVLFQTFSLHLINLNLGSVLFACKHFESLILSTKGIASLIQNYSAISELNLNRPPEKPPYGHCHTENTTVITNSIQTCLFHARRNVPMQPLSPKPPDHSFQLKPGEFQVLWEFIVPPLPPPLPPEPPDVDH